MEALADRSVRDRRQQVCCDLGLLVMTHGHVERVCDRGGAPPFCRAARPRRVEVADVDRPLRHQVAAACGRQLRLAGANANRSPEADVAHCPAVVRPAAGLLEPGEIVLRHEPGEPDRLARAPALVRVGREDEVGAGCRAGLAEAGGVLVGRSSAHLELEPGEPQLAGARRSRRRSRSRCRSTRRSRSSTPSGDSRPRGARAAGRGPCPTASQIAVSTHAVATSPRRLSRRMS